MSMTSHPTDQQVLERLLISNERLAAANRQRLDAAGVRAINIIASPGAGKTSLISRLITTLRDQVRIGVIEGDIAGRFDAETVLEAGAADAVQINTGGNCHLEANMIQQALDQIDLAQIDLLIVENVGNLICPTHWQLGEHLKICMSSTTEGNDKPAKYPDIFKVSQAIVLNKIDLAERLEFDRAFFYDTVRALNPDAPIFETSCRTGAGIDTLAEWMLAA
jgi:hydrogenase nickel incorporation protein HypB